MLVLQRSEEVRNPTANSSRRGRRGEAGRLRCHGHTVTVGLAARSCLVRCLVVALGLSLVLAFATACAGGDEAEPTAGSGVETGVPVPFDVCSRNDNWERPSDEEQRQHLLSLGRYDDLDPEAPLSGRYRENLERIVWRGTGSGSGTFDTVQMSGLWTIADQGTPILGGGDSTPGPGCQEGPPVSEGERCELWVLGYDVVSLELTGDEVYVAVRAIPLGFRIVQFDNPEPGVVPAIHLVDPGGRELAFVAGGEFPGFDRSPPPPPEQP